MLKRVCVVQSQQALVAKEQQTSFYSHWTGGSGGICGILDASDASRSPTSTSPPTPLAAHPQAPLVSAQNGVRSPEYTLQDSNREVEPAQNGLRSPQHGSAPPGMRSPNCGRNGFRAPEQTSPSVQAPIGPRMTHRKSSSLDTHQAPNPAMLTAFGGQQHHLQQPSAPSRAPNHTSRSSPRPQHAQHTLPSGSGAMSSLLGLTGFADRGDTRNDLRGLRTSKSLQQQGHNRGPSRAGSFIEHNVEQVLSSGFQDTNGRKSVGPSWMQQGHPGGHHGNVYHYSNAQGLAGQVNASHRQLHS